MRNALKVVMHANEWGISIGDAAVAINMPQVQERKDKIVGGLTKGIEFLFKKNKIDWIKGTARLTGNGRVDVFEGEKQALRARKDIIVATGSSPRGVPGIEIDRKRIITSDEAIQLREVPKTMAIQQGGIAPTAFGSLSIGSLTCTRGQLMGQRFALTATGIIVGRQPGVAHVLVNDSRASGKHVWIGYENGVLVAVDQGTTNGTFVNDVRYGRISKAPLKDGDIVIVSEPDCLSLQLKLS